jgi:16S rRNA (guanine527-N7)-methyltransferase
MVDIGSGGGSPAIPLRVCLPGVRAILVEVKVRKAAFLREVIRQLALENVEVENRRFEELLARTELHETIDLVTIRAVRGDRRLWMAVQGFLRPGGQVFWFGGATGEVETLPTFELVGRETLTSANGSVLTVLRRR